MSDYIMEIIKETTAKLGNWIATGVINSSYSICLFCSMTALILYMAGMKSAGKYVPVSFIIYFLLQSIKGVVLK